MKPSVGRVVHYMSEGSPIQPDGTQKYASACRAAVVTEVDSDDDALVGLCVLNPTGDFFRPIATGGSVQDEDAHAGGTWHHPERVMESL